MEKRGNRYIRDKDVEFQKFTERKNISKSAVMWVEVYTGCKYKENSSLESKRKRHRQI